MRQVLDTLRVHEVKLNVNKIVNGVVKKNFWGVVSRDGLRKLPKYVDAIHFCNW